MKNARGKNKRLVCVVFCFFVLCCLKRRHPTNHGKPADGVAGEHCVQKLCAQLLSFQPVVQGHQYDLPYNLMPDAGRVKLSERKHCRVHVAILNIFLSNSKKSVSELLDVSQGAPQQLNAGKTARLNEKKTRAIADRLAVISAKCKTGALNKMGNDDSNSRRMR
jgi:hypothetical protein